MLMLCLLCHRGVGVRGVCGSCFVWCVGVNPLFEVYAKVFLKQLKKSFASLANFQNKSPPVFIVGLLFEVQV